jgi:hypothetical protein
MDEKRHNEIMDNIIKQLDQGDLNLADGISIWHSLGLFLFSNIDENNNDVVKIYETMEAYIHDMKDMKNMKCDVK